MTVKTIKRSVLIKGAEALEHIYLKIEPDETPIANVRARVSQIISEKYFAEVIAYLKEPSEYEITEYI